MRSGLERSDNIIAAYPELEAFVIPDVRTTRRIGSGVYGVVDEVALPSGTICAAKWINLGFFNDEPSAYLEDFVTECKLISSLRHPHIVQFFGICFFPGSWMPALVMERMETSLYQALAPEAIVDDAKVVGDDANRPWDPPKPVLELDVKFSILHNVASGLAYLHARQVVHRNLSAKNVLLTAAMVAKIADFSDSRMVTDK